jgi:hypothetical protein
MAFKFKTTKTTKTQTKTSSSSTNLKTAQEVEEFINGWHAYVRSDVYAGSTNEDGEQTEELSYYIICENGRGVRYASKHGFTTARFGHNSNGVAERLAERFCVSVKEALRGGASPVFSSKWVQVQSAYWAREWNRQELENEVHELESESGAGSEEANRFRKAVGL